MNLKGHALDFRIAAGGKTELYLDGELEGIFDNQQEAIEYVQKEIEEKV